MQTTQPTCYELCPFYCKIRPGGAGKSKGGGMGNATCNCDIAYNRGSVGEPTRKGKPCLHPKALEPRVNNS